nr:hypothetical protein CFP56_44317 [Quercus suber]
MLAPQDVLQQRRLASALYTPRQHSPWEDGEEGGFRREPTRNPESSVTGSAFCGAALVLAGVGIAAFWERVVALGILLGGWEVKRKKKGRYLLRLRICNGTIRSILSTEQR